MNRWLSLVLRTAPFIAWHVLAATGALLFLPGWRELLLAGGVYAAGMFAVTAGYHRYFAHKSFRTSRVGQLALAWAAQSTLQKGVLWWAAHHRTHHRSSDRPGDPHSPIVRGLWQSHIGWILSDDSLSRDDTRVPDLLRYPELRWLDRYYLVPPLVLAGGMALAGGWSGLVWGFAIPILAVQHATFLINSLAHLWGSRPYPTPDRSRNNPLLAALTFGEGWHNNHHHYQGAARQGFRWWEVDVTWYGLRALRSVGLVWDLREPPERIRRDARSRALQRAVSARERAARAHDRAVALARRTADSVGRAATELADAIAHEASLQPSR